jgi:hypothetical protein
MLDDLAISVSMSLITALLQPPLPQGLVVGFRSRLEFLVKVNFTIVHWLGGL